MIVVLWIVINRKATTRTYLAISGCFRNCAGHRSGRFLRQCADHGSLLFRRLTPGSLRGHTGIYPYREKIYCYPREKDCRPKSGEAAFSSGLRPKTPKRVTASNEDILPSCK